MHTIIDESCHLRNNNEILYAHALRFDNIVPMRDVVHKCWWLPISGAARMVWAKS
jgi:hypothetical protein